MVVCSAVLCCIVCFVAGNYCCFVENFSLVLLTLMSLHKTGHSIKYWGQMQFCTHQLYNGLLFPYSNYLFYVILVSGILLENFYFMSLSWLHRFHCFCYSRRLLKMFSFLWKYSFLRLRALVLFFNFHFFLSYLLNQQYRKCWWWQQHYTHSNTNWMRINHYNDSVYCTVERTFVVLASISKSSVSLV